MSRPNRKPRNTTKTTTTAQTFDITALRLDAVASRAEQEQRRTVAIAEKRRLASLMRR